MIEIFRTDPAHAAEARGIVIVIDVIRAFSVAGYAFAGGAQGIWLVRSADEAIALRERNMTALLIGEIGGRSIAGFDLNNSPAHMSQANVHGKQLIQRTGAGTQGAVNAINATRILLCAFTNAQATATYTHSLAQELQAPVTLLPTAGINTRIPRSEDDFCADYVEALLQQRQEAEAIPGKARAYLDSIQRFAQWQAGSYDFPIEDIDAAFATNRFTFAMEGTRQEWHSIHYVDAQRVDISQE
ncbi:MAG TPA: 2-phosphosulfolactate phosphatase [Ktedonobacteraceae bacterium]|jgi:2-phosphosulfolactate phosphatase